MSAIESGLLDYNRSRNIWAEVPEAGGREHVAGPSRLFIGFWIALFILPAGFIGVAALSEAREAADRSAHLALYREIGETLAAIPAGEPYPGSLVELKLTYPDGGDSSLLERFRYQAAGHTCTISTTIAGEERTKAFP